ncbi:hypothetical protein [Alishewanella phage vB_AspM_Slickus01]|nr:hypothetical protein [Alishewanella phage vB_AspM_Slicko01]WGH49831.1 hypothetical protein [Alishewanella phage vB_AspM_Slickus01]
MDNQKIQHLMARRAILGDFIKETTEELAKAMADYKEINEEMEKEREREIK